ncbi:hypothetical protein TIFTF001_003735 [Ficus carica]|uniref:Cytochrome P450 n=1 Tax=Ficus carica TaxID=3494 RepID=A0AA87ZET6_FICCA|nr:hypothetical protein TIFTF001_003735 [Ficus carica]
MEAMSFDPPGGLVSSPYGEYWRQMRNICVVELLSPKCVASFWSVREEEVWSLIESISKNSSSHVVNFSAMIISTMIATISRVVFGKKCRHHDEYVSSYWRRHKLRNASIAPHPPAPLLERESRERCQIPGYDIPYKAKRVINAWALGRDPQVWNNADCFEPERFFDSTVDLKGTDFEFVPFGAERRMCPRILFSFPNMELVLAQLFHFDWYSQMVAKWKNVTCPRSIK